MLSKYAPAYTMKYANIKNTISLIVAVKAGAKSLYEIKLKTSINGVRLSEVYIGCLAKGLIKVQCGNITLSPLGEDLYQRWEDLCDVFEKRSKLSKMLDSA